MLPYFSHIESVQDSRIYHRFTELRSYVCFSLILFLLILVFVRGCCRYMCRHFGWVCLGIVFAWSSVNEPFRLWVWNGVVRAGMQGDSAFWLSNEVEKPGGASLKRPRVYFGVLFLRVITKAHIFIIINITFPNGQNWGRNLKHLAGAILCLRACREFTVAGLALEVYILGILGLFLGFF